MKYQSVGDTGLNASCICFGGGDLGSAIPLDAAFALLDVFMETGGNFLDTARVYADWVPGGSGASERAIGAWLRSRGVREQVVLATKGAHPDLKAMQVDRMSPEEIAHDLNASLEALGVESVDLYWLHRDAPSVPVGEIMSALADHVRAGRIRALGASNWTPERIDAANIYARTHGLTPFSASQIAWSLATQPSDPVQRTLAMDEATHTYHVRTGLPLVAYTSQARGFFSGKYAPGRGDPQSLVARLFFNDRNFERLARAQALAAHIGCTPNEVALAYLLNQPFPVFPIVGAHTPAQVHNSCAAADVQLSPADIAYLELGGV